MKFMLPIKKKEQTIKKLHKAYLENTHKNKCYHARKSHVNHRKCYREWKIEIFSRENPLQIDMERKAFRDLIPYTCSISKSAKGKHKKRPSSIRNIEWKPIHNMVERWRQYWQPIWLSKRGCRTGMIILPLARFNLRLWVRRVRKQEAS